MAFFTFSLLNDSFIYLSTRIEPKQKYYSKDIALRKELNNRNKTQPFALVNFENRKHITKIGKKLLICLPPNFGLGDAIEYGIAIKSLIQSKKFDKIGIAFCSNHSFIFKDFFCFLEVYPLFISKDQINIYDTVFHITLEINSLKFQKYKRSNIALEICKYFEVPLLDFKAQNYIMTKSHKKIISIFPVSTSTIRSLPFNVIEKIIENFGNEYQIKVVVDDSEYSRHLLKKNKNSNVIFVQPKSIESLILEISRLNFGIFIDSGPLHIAKSYNKNGILIETSVSSEILLTNSKNILPIKNKYKSLYCNGPCGLVDVFAYEGNVGCYETHRLSFEDISSFKSYKNLQRWNKKENNSHFILNPVGCIQQIDINNIIELIKNKLKES